MAIELTDAEIDEIEAADAFDPGFPMNFLFGYGTNKPYSTRMTSNDIALVTASTALESVPKARVRLLLSSFVGKLLTCCLADSTETRREQTQFELIGTNNMIRINGVDFYNVS